MIKETWRGWQGHFCCKCEWHLNTLLELNGKKYIVSTVGFYKGSADDENYVSIGADGRLFETMTFESSYDEWDDIDAMEDEWDFFRSYMTEREAQKGHYEVLEQVKKWMLEENGCSA